MKWFKTLFNIALVIAAISVFTNVADAKTITFAEIEEAFGSDLSSLTAPKIREHYTNNVLLFLYVVMNETANGYVGSESF